MYVYTDYYDDWCRKGINNNIYMHLHASAVNVEQNWRVRSQICRCSIVYESSAHSHTYTYNIYRESLSYRDIILYFSYF